MLKEETPKKKKPEQNNFEETKEKIKVEQKLEMKSDTPMIKINKFCSKTFLERLEEEIQVELEPYLIKEIKEHKKDFLEWLFKVTKVDSSGEIISKELNVLLRGVIHDGI
jgi:hypothetical protein